MDFYIVIDVVQVEFSLFYYGRTECLLMFWQSLKLGQEKNVFR